MGTIKPDGTAGEPGREEKFTRQSGILTLDMRTPANTHLKFSYATIKNKTNRTKLKQAVLKTDFFSQFGPTPPTGPRRTPTEPGGVLERHSRREIKRTN